MRPALRNLISGQKLNHTDINALRRWVLDGYNIRRLDIKPSTDSPTSKIDVTVDLAAMRSVGGEVAIESAASTPAISLTLDTETTGVGGLDTGKLSTTGLYAIYLAAKADDENGLASQVGVISSSNWQNPALPAGWTHKRLIGAFATKDNEGQTEIKPFTQVDDWFLYHEAQTVLAWNGLDKPVERKALELGNWMPLVCEEVHLDAQIYGGAAPFYLKLYEHSTGQEIIDLRPASEDFGHESTWIFAPRQMVDYSIGVTSKVYGGIAVLGFRIPISQEF